ncbi:transglutaminase domain-containing protein [Actinomadura keratinilytica]
MPSTLAQPWNTPALHSGEVVDHGASVVRRLAATLGADRLPVHEYAEAAFTYVRDRVAHSDDTGDPRVTWRASDVLTSATGICHAKAHALCALLRAAASRPGSATSGCAGATRSGDGRPRADRPRPARRRRLAPAGPARRRTRPRRPFLPHRRAPGLAGTPRTRRGRPPRRPRHRSPPGAHRPPGRPGP